MTDKPTQVPSGYAKRYVTQYAYNNPYYIYPSLPVTQVKAAEAAPWVYNNGMLTLINDREMQHLLCLLVFFKFCQAVQIPLKIN